jgi:hypothetical protein
MKSLFVVCFILLAFSFNVFGMLLFVPLDEAVKNSDLIVVGILQGISEKSESGTTYGTGKIFVERFIAGNVKTAEGVTLKSGDRLQLNYFENFACVYGSHKRIENEKGVFLLTLDNNGEIQSKDFRSLDDLPEIRKLLKKGIKPSAIAKTIKILNDAEQKPQRPVIETSVNQNPEKVFCSLDSKKSNEKQYHPLQAFSVVLFSVFLYFVLYRSRFKIR